MTPHRRSFLIEMAIRATGTAVHHSDCTEPAGIGPECARQPIPDLPRVTQQVRQLSKDWAA